MAAEGQRVAERDTLKPKHARRLQPGMVLLPLWLLAAVVWIGFLVYADGFALLGVGPGANRMLWVMLPLVALVPLLLFWLELRWRRGPLLEAHVVDVRFRGSVGKAAPRGHRGRRPEWGWDGLCEYTYRGKAVREWLVLIRRRNSAEVKAMPVEDVTLVNVRLLEVSFLGKKLWQARVARRDNVLVFRRLLGR